MLSLLSRSMLKYLAFLCLSLSMHLFVTAIFCKYFYVYQQLLYVPLFYYSNLPVNQNLSPKFVRKDSANQIIQRLNTTQEQVAS